jgi:peptide/nickel transport system substrate-binding protein
MNETRSRALMSRRAILRAGLGAAAIVPLAGLLDACASASSSSVTLNQTAGANTGKTITTLKVAFPSSLSNLYPGIESGILNYYVAALVTEGLVGMGPTGETVPAVASSWRQTDETTYVYQLRADAKYSDGTAVTPEDVVYSMQMAANAKASPSVASYFSGVKSVTKTGPAEVTVTLSAPAESWSYTPSIGTPLCVMPESFWKQNNDTVGTAQALLLGTGPYKVTSFQPDSHVYLEASDTWWDGKPKVDAIQIQFISDPNAQYLAQKAGDTQMSFNVPLESLDQWAALPGNRVVSYADKSWVGLILDTKSGPTKDIHVRRAIGYCVDRQAIVTDLLKGQGQVAYAMSPPNQFPGVYTPAQATAELAGIPQLNFSLANAKAELKQSAYPDGFTATITYPNSGPQLGTAALSLAANLKQIGITLNVQEATLSQWLATVGTAAGGPIQYMWYFTTTPDPAEIPSYLLGADNPAGYVNSQVSALLAKANTEFTAAPHAATIIEAQKLAAADVPYLPLWWGKSVIAFSDQIGDTDLTAYTLDSPWTTALYSAS